MGGSINGIFHYKPSILGYPLLWKPYNPHILVMVILRKTYCKWNCHPQVECDRSWKRQLNGWYLYWNVVDVYIYILLYIYTYIIIYRTIYYNIIFKLYIYILYILCVWRFYKLRHVCSPRSKSWPAPLGSDEKWITSSISMLHIKFELETSLIIDRSFRPETLVDCIISLSTIYFLHYVNENYVSTISHDISINQQTSSILMNRLRTHRLP